MKTITLIHPMRPEHGICHCQARELQHVTDDHDFVASLTNVRRVCRHCGQEPIGQAGCSCSAGVDILAERDGETIAIRFDA